MRQNEKTDPCPRGRGRPQVRSHDETRRILVAAARREFTAKGYAGTCMSDLAQAAGISTKTMYRLVPTKADLFALVIAERAGQFILEIDDKSLAGLTMEAALERILTAFGTLTLNKETIALNRLVIGEYERFPELAHAFYERAVNRVSAAIRDWLERQQQRGLLSFVDTEVATGVLRGMMIMDLQRAAMLGQRPAPNVEEIAERARLCAKIFLDGCRAKDRIDRREGT